MRLLLLLLVLLTLPATAQTAVEEFEVDGVPVILRRNAATPVVAAGIFLRGGASAVPAELAGLQQLALTAAVQGGTKALPKDEFHRVLSSLGSEISADVYADLSQITMRAVRPNLERTWDLVAGVLTEPAFLPVEVELARRQQLAALRMESDNPDNLLRRLAEEDFFAGHPYANRPIGRTETVSRFTPDQVASYYRDLLTRGRLLVVFVGDVDRPTVEALLRRSVCRLPAGEEVTWKAPELPAARSAARLESREVPTWYVRGTFAVPPPSAPDYAAAMIAAETLSDRLFREARTKRNLVYSIYSALSGRSANYGLLYFTSAKPAEVAAIVREEVRRLATEPLDPDDLQGQVNVFLTSRFMSEASARDQVLRLGHAELVAGDWRKADAFVEAVKTVTPAQVQAAAARYFRDAEFVLVGPEKGVDLSGIRL